MLVSVVIKIYTIFYFVHTVNVLKFRTVVTCHKQSRPRKCFAQGHNTVTHGLLGLVF